MITASAVAEFRQDINDIKRELGIVRWMVGTVVTLQLTGFAAVIMLLINLRLK